MDDDQRIEAFHSALVTEHFVLQSAASATISESSSRSSLYLLSLSSSLVALGFALQASEDAFAPFAAAVLPTLFVLGWFTVVRLVDTSIENVRCLRAIAHIRRYYAQLTPEASDYFRTLGDDAADARWLLGSTRHTTFTYLYTMASMIGAVNAVVGATTVALLLDGVIGAPRAVAILAAVLVAAVLFAGVVLYERRRFDAALGGD